MRFISYNFGQTNNKEDIMSLSIENFENAYNSYVAAWQTAPVKMAAGHLTAAATIGAGIYFRKDISAAASKCMNDAVAVVKASKTFNAVTDFASKSITSISSKAIVAKDATVSSAKAATNVALKGLNTVKDATVSSAKTATNFAMTNATNAKNATASFVSNSAASLNDGVKSLASVVKAKVTSFKI